MTSFSDEDSKKDLAESVDDRTDATSTENLKSQGNSDIALEVLHAGDDPSLNALTFRTWSIGVGLGAFGAIVNTMFHFRPRILDISQVLLALAAYILGIFMEKCTPKSGFIGYWFNPHPFNSKEHTAIIIIASSASQVPIAIQVIAVQKLYYNNAPSTALSLLIVLSTQCLGYGFAGILRRAVVYPAKMVWPMLLPVNSLLEVLHQEREKPSHRRRIMYWVFTAILLWQFLPEYIMPILSGVSVFCLANQSSTIFTTIFGGSNRNEGLGLLSLGLDWRFITSQPLWYPLQTLTNNLIGYIICIALFAAVYYGNAWRAQDFPFLSQLLYSGNSTSSNFILHGQKGAVDEQGLPYFTGTFAISLFTNSLYITSTIVHLLLWNWPDIRKAWDFARPQRLRKLVTLSFWTSNPEVVEHDEVVNNPHYQFMRAYKEGPNWWYAAVFITSTIIGLVCIYTANTTLPWYGFLISILLAAILCPFFGAQAALTGYQGKVQPLMHLLGGLIHPGSPTANLYFTLFGHASITHALNMTRSLKLGQYAKLPPRITFVAQLLGTLLGSVISHAVMTAITADQRSVLLDPPSNTAVVWSAARPQHLRALATAFGDHGLSLFSLARRPLPRYALIPLGLLLGPLLTLPAFFLSRLFPSHSTITRSLNTPLVAASAGVLATLPSTSAMPAYFAVGFASQFWLRRYRPGWFARHNYVVAAAVEAGAQVCGVLVTLLLRGGLGGWAEVPMPGWWGNNVGGNFDRCPAAGDAAAGLGMVRDAGGGL
ncbi:hypothetical protein SLS54_002745 [Diplodia seriata]|uniref:Oligopeptide transporter 3 n=1 Tax=Diplodia seriata TaxID=420778 RepID=A0A1S8BPI4_9PEZI|nr:Oligopeptide transporter 3 [Diplodia seriata]